MEKKSSNRMEFIHEFIITAFVFLTAKLSVREKWKVLNYKRDEICRTDEPIYMSKNRLEYYSQVGREKVVIN